MTRNARSGGRSPEEARRVSAMRAQRAVRELLRRSREYRAVPGKWYVSYPEVLGPLAPPVAGPFDSEELAWTWKNKASLFEGGEVWQCQGGDKARPEVPAGGREGPRPAPGAGQDQRR